ncbi:MAG: hypothetical protein COC05_01665 [Gammaproteobacteria bacterium]|nr:MAG: hypothetical protein COC05_01665 [Gammaproteobacteria bacterium]
MKQAQFEQKYQERWQGFERLIQDLEKRKNKRQISTDNHYDFPKIYRDICSHYAIARQRYYSPVLIRRLHALVLAGQVQLYRHQTIWLWKVFEFVLATFPQMFRKHIKVFWLATALFYGPAVAMGLACYMDSQYMYSVMDRWQVAEMEYMYDPENKNIGRKEEREADTDFMMFGYYIFNNVSIGFRTFASGILLGIGTLFILFYNGIVIGGVAGYLTQLGYTETFWPFVSGHGSFELTAIVISGMAGLILARPIFAPGNMTRINALKRAAQDSIQLMIGAALMLFIAAFIEAFWSSSTSVPISVKLGVAAVLWAGVTLYLSLAGRTRSEH